MGIGALSAATGIPSSTLRTWERRYGFPQAQRTQGGHRLYPAGTIDRLIWVQRALAGGHRPRQVLGLSPPELQLLIEPNLVRIGEEQAAGKVSLFGEVPASDFDRWVDAVRELDEAALHSLIVADWGRLGTLKFIEERLAPFLVLVGDLWVRGVLGIRHEHFASERARDFLVAIWRPLSAARKQPVVLCATLPGELHVLGLHMAACVCAMAGSHVVFLGPGLPVADIVAAARDSAAEAVMVSISRNMDRGEASAHLAAIVEKTHGIPLVIGGHVVSAPESAVVVASLSELEAWVRGVVIS